MPNADNNPFCHDSLSETAHAVMCGLSFLAQTQTLPGIDLGEDAEHGHHLILATMRDALDAHRQT